MTQILQMFRGGTLCFSTVPSWAGYSQQHPSWHRGSDPQQEVLFSQLPLRSALLHRSFQYDAPPCPEYAVAHKTLIYYIYYNTTIEVILLVQHTPEYNTNYQVWYVIPEGIKPMTTFASKGGRLTATLCYHCTYTILHKQYQYCPFMLFMK